MALTRRVSQAGADPAAVNVAGLTPLEYAAKEGHVACAEALAQAASLQQGPRPRATAALLAVAQAPWRITCPTATPLPVRERQSAAALLVCALRRMLQPWSDVDRGGARAPYFKAGLPLLARLAALDNAAPGAALCLRVNDAGDEGTVASATLHDAAQHAADAAAVAIALAGALAAPGQAAMGALRVRGFALPQRPNGGLSAIWPHAHLSAVRTCTAVNALTECAMTALADALAAAAAPRHVTIQLVAPVAWSFVGVSPSPSAEDAVACLPSATAAAFSRALRAGWAQDGALRSLTLQLPRGMRLCPQQRLLLCTRALEAPHGVVTAVLLGACHPRSRSPLRLLSTELLRRVLADCVFAVRIVERDALDE